MYTIIDKTFVRFEGTKSVYHADIGCDTEADLPPVETDTMIFAPMSIALIADTHTIKVLNHEGEWV